jgi:7-carboxy-7-deazaguanine synthase
MSLGRIEDYDKVLPVVECYRCVQSEGSRIGTPTIAVRTTGCTHRCFFGEGGWCDSWYTSIHPEKGTVTFNDIVKMYDDNPQIKEMMLTGGSPTMHKKLVNELTHFAAQRDIFITIETEGSHFLETDHPINLLSISPKFKNSLPVIGEKTPQGKIVDQKMINTHNRFRMNRDAIIKSMAYHDDYHYKPVWDGEDMSVIADIVAFGNECGMAKDKTYVMPAGDTRENLIKTYDSVMNWCIKSGYKMTYRPHIMAYQDKRAV